MNAPDLSTLTGLRSGKPTFYPQYRGAAERLERVVHALELISRALVRTVEGPETLICAVAEAARAHLDAQWVAFALADGMLPDAGPRRLVLGPDATPFLVDNVEGPPLAGRGGDVSGRHPVRAHWGAPVIDTHHAFVPIVLEGGVVGAFAAWTAEHRTLDTTDGAVLSILASQTAVALQNSALYQRGQLLLERAEHAYSEARRNASDLAVRNAELESTSVNSERPTGTRCSTRNGTGSPANSTTASPRRCCRPACRSRCAGAVSRTRSAARGSISQRN